MKTIRTFVRWVRASLRREFWTWVIGGAVVLVVLPWGLREGLCHPENVGWTVEGHRRATQGQYETAEESFFIAQKKKSKEDKKDPDDPNYHWPCGEPKTTDLFLVFFTYVLAIATWFTMRSADENTKRAQRAYLVATPLFGVPRKEWMPENDTRTNWMRQYRAKKTMFKEPWRMGIINFGQTAAFTTLVEWGFCPREQFDTTVPVSKLLDDPEYATFRSEYMDGQTQIQDIFSPNADAPLHYRHLELSDEERKKYINWVFFGRIKYKDVFMEGHHSTFSYHLIEEHGNSIGKSLSDDHS